MIQPPRPRTGSGWHLRAPIAGAAEPRRRTRLFVDVLTTDGANVRAEFRIKLDTVELWHHQELVAAFDRQVMRDWLHKPNGHLVADQAQLTVDWQVDTSGRIALTLPDVDAWTLSPTERDALYRRVVVQAA